MDQKPEWDTHHNHTLKRVHILQEMFWMPTMKHNSREKFVVHQNVYTALSSVIL